MINYEEMSDHEINMTVTCIVHNLHGWSVNENNNAFYHCGVDGSGHYMVNCIDFCNNPNDAWPIIVENNIAISPNIVFDKEKIEGWESWSTFCNYVDKNPLRAAMICFLKMKDNEQ